MRETYPKEIRLDEAGVAYLWGGAGWSQIKVPPVVVRHSQLADFRHCPLKEKWGWRFEGGWFDPRKEQGDNPRSRGHWWHTVLEVHYSIIQEDQQDGEQPDPDFIYDQVMEMIEQAPVEIQEVLAWMYDGYIEKWWADDLKWRVIAVEQTLRVPFFDNGEPLWVFDWETKQRRPVFYEFTSDIVAEVPEYRGTFVIDTKSTAQMLGQVDIDLSDQFGLYTLGWQRLGRKVRGQMINQALTKQLKRAQTLDERFDRKVSIRTDEELREIERDAVSTVKAMYSEENTLHPYSAPDPRTCGWKCDFKEAHLQYRRMRKKDPIQLGRLLRARGLESGNTHGRP